MTFLKSKSTRFAATVCLTLFGCNASDVSAPRQSSASGAGAASGVGADQGTEAGSSGTTSAGGQFSNSAPAGLGGGGADSARAGDSSGGSSAGSNTAGSNAAGASAAGSNTAGSGAGDPFPHYQPVPSGKFDEVPLFQGDPPNFKQGATPETVGSGGRIYDVSVPTLRRYPMDISKATGIGFVVFPGGGYTHLDIERHATALATRMGPQGIAVFGLKYRVGKGSNDVRRDALLDANRAIRLLRENAGDWGVSSDRVGVVSYSAGSHLAMNFAGHFDLGQANSTDPVEAQSSRPAFFASMCTWDSGNSTSKFTFLAATPPVYLCHAKDDTTAPIALAYAVEKQLQALNVVEHLEVYATGGHDSFNVGETAEGHDWPDKFTTWLRANSIVP